MDYQRNERTERSEDGKSSSGQDEPEFDASSRSRRRDGYASLPQHQAQPSLHNAAIGYPSMHRLEELLLLQRGGQTASTGGIHRQNFAQSSTYNPALQRQALLMQLHDQELREARIRLLIQRQQSQQHMFSSPFFSSLMHPQLPAATSSFGIHNAQSSLGAPPSFVDARAAVSSGLDSRFGMLGPPRLGSSANTEANRFPRFASGVPADRPHTTAASLSRAPVATAQATLPPTEAKSPETEFQTLTLNEASVPPVASLSPRNTTDDDTADMSDKEYFSLFGNSEGGQQVINETFPHRLYRMLWEVENSGQDDIVSFFPHGKAFIVHKPREFTSKILPNYFSTNRMSSFQRQLNLYGFQRIDDGDEKGGFVHQYFQKGRRSMCNKIKRQKTKSQNHPAPPQGQTGASLPRNSIQPGSQGLGLYTSSTYAQVGLHGQASASVPASDSLPQNQRAAALLQQLLSQQDEEESAERKHEG